jgi:hypothetical protein
MPPQVQGDIYSRWLGITEKNRPLSHYQLMRLKNFEDDPSQIRAHYNKMSAHVRKYLATEYADKAHGLLNELTKAMLCLTDSRRKSDYDATLGRSAKGETRKRSLEEILIKRKVVDAEQMAKAKKLAAAIGVELHEALVQQKIPANVVSQALAESQGLSYVDLQEIEFDLDLIGKMPAMMARQYSAVPLMIDNDRILVASPNPLPANLEDELRLRMGMTIRSVICTPAAVHEIVNKFYPREAAAREMGVTSAQDAEDAEEEFDPEAIAERKKNRLKFTGVAAAMTFAASAISIQIAGQFSRDLAAVPLLTQYGVGLLLALVVAGITWFVKRK